MAECHHLSDEPMAQVIPVPTFMYSVKAKATEKGSGPRQARRDSGKVTERITLFRRVVCEGSIRSNTPGVIVVSDSFKTVETVIGPSHLIHHHHHYHQHHHYNYHHKHHCHCHGFCSIKSVPASYTMFRYFHPCPATFSHYQPYPAILSRFNHIQPFPDVSSYFQTCPAIFKHFQTCAAIFGHTQPLLDLSAIFSC